MIIAPDGPGKVDPYWLRILDEFKADAANSDVQDDSLIIICGAPGAGKSNIGLSSIEHYMGETVVTWQISLTRKDFADSIHKGTHTPLPRSAMYDEASVKARDATSKWNKDVMDLYWSIRGLRFLHIWINPSIQGLDKAFIEERCKCVIFCIGKEKHRPRTYYLFRRKELLDIYLREGDLKLHTLERNISKAYMRGWYRKYEGPLLEPYLALKDDRMVEKVETFYNTYGSGSDAGMGIGQTAKQCGISVTTLKRYLIEIGDRLQDTIKTAPTGYRTFMPEAIPIITQHIEENRRKRSPKVQPI